MTAHPTTEQLRQCLEEKLPEAEARGVEDHVEECPACQEAMDRLTADSSSDLAARFPHHALPEGGNRLPLRFPHGRVGPYVIEKMLGEGGFGAVFLAGDELGRKVAVKVPRAEVAGELGPNALVDEARAMAAVRHENVVTVFHSGLDTELGLPYFVMEYVQGPSLRDWLQEQTTVAPRQAAEIMLQIVRGLEAIHALPLVHGDVKAGNVLVDAGSSRVKVTDFGIARAPRGDDPTCSPRAFGTLPYMSPEQFRRAEGQPMRVDGRSDLYAAGVILYELLARRRPFEGNQEELILAILNEEPTPPRRRCRNVPRDLDTICLKCLEKEPGKRYATAADLAADLERFLDGKPIAARPASIVDRVVKWCRRRPTAAALIAVLVLAIGMAVVGAVQYQHRRFEAERADRNLQHALRAADFISTDLAAGLEVAGLPSQAVERILDGAEQAYQDLLEDGRSPEALAGKGRLRNAFADIYLETNNSRRAAAAAREARYIFDNLLQQAPDNPIYLAGAGTARDKQGMVLVARGHRSDALSAFRDSVAKREQLVGIDPKGPQWQKDLAESYFHLGATLGLRGDARGEEASYWKGFALYEAVFQSGPENPDWKSAYALAHEKIGDLQFYRDMDKAIASYRKALGFLEDLLQEEPTHVLWQRQRNRVGLSLGQSLKAKSDFEGAKKAFTAAFEHARHLKERDPANITTRTEYLRARLHLAYQTWGADATPGPGDLDEQLRTLEELVAATESLSRQDDDNFRWKSQMASLHFQIAHVHYRRLGRGRPAAECLDKALEALRNAERLLEIVVQRDPTSVADMNTRIGAQFLRGEVLRLQHRETESIRAHARAQRTRIDWQERLTTLYPNTPPWPDELASALSSAEEFFRGKAIPHFEKLPRTGPGGKEVADEVRDAHQALARIYRLRGEKDKEKAELQKAAALR